MHSKSGPRRRHSVEFKREVMAACAEPGASVAAVARRFELNDNLVHQWRRGRGLNRGPGGRRASPLAEQPAAAQFVALSLPLPQTKLAASLQEGIRIQLKRGALGVSVEWPAAAAPECAAWLRELLR
jgi:transposase